MKAVKSFVITENESKINWSPNGDTMYAIVNKDQKTALGEYPGYRISPGEHTSTATMGRKTNSTASIRCYLSHCE